MIEGNVVRAGVPIEKAHKVLIMLHGRGATAKDILALSSNLHVKDFHLIAPEAKGNSWYPFSFLTAIEDNQPYLDHALNLLKEVLDSVLAVGGFSSQDVFILGFSQGACLALEFAARNAALYGGVIAFTGGLIGETLKPNFYLGTFQHTAIFIGNSDKDPHVPLSRSTESKVILESLGAKVILKVYPDMPHTITKEEIDYVNQFILTTVRH